VVLRGVLEEELEREDKARAKFDRGLQPSGLEFLTVASSFDIDTPASSGKGMYRTAGGVRVARGRPARTGPLDSGLA
jgi:hypothetical protein